MTPVILVVLAAGCSGEKGSRAAGERTRGAMDGGRATATPPEAKANRTTQGTTYPRELLRAIASGDLALVRMLLQRGARLDVTDSRGETPLARAVRIGDRRLLVLLAGAAVSDGSLPPDDSHLEANPSRLGREVVVLLEDRTVRGGRTTVIDVQGRVIAEETGTVSSLNLGHAGSTLVFDGEVGHGTGLYEEERVLLMRGEDHRLHRFVAPLAGHVVPRVLPPDVHEADVWLVKEWTGDLRLVTCEGSAPTFIEAVQWFSWQLLDQTGDVPPDTKARVSRALSKNLGVGLGEASERLIRRWPWPTRLGPDPIDADLLSLPTDEFCTAATISELRRRERK